MAWTSIFSSSNFWTALSGFGGTVLGGFITWKIQRASEEKRQREMNLLAFRYHAIMIEKVHHAAFYIKPAFAMYKSDPTRHLKIPKQFSVLPKYQERDTTTDLHFLSDKKYSDLLASLENYRQHFEMLSKAFGLRNKYFQELLDITSPFYQRGQNLTMEEVKRHIGPKLNGDLMSLTEMVENHISYLTNKYVQLRKLIVDVAQEKFPSETFLELDISHQSGNQP